MSTKKSSARNLLVSFVWLVIIITLALVWKFVVAPEQKKKLTEDTGADSQYKHRVHLGLDSFSGYSVLRSPLFKDLLRRQAVKLVPRDDGGDTVARMKALRKRELQMAVFTVDSFILGGVQQGDWPGSIILIIDESRGADAIVAHPDGPAAVKDLDDPAARFVLTPNSPSEFLSRVVISHFNLPKLSSNWQDPADGAGAVFRRYMADGGNGKRAYALWEPWITKAVRDGAAKVLVDTARLRGYIVDVLVVERKFLQEQPELARSIVQAYLAAAHHYTRDEARLTTLVKEDASSGETLSNDEAGRVAKGILWKNTLENYAHFGVLPPSERLGLTHIEDLIARIADVLSQTDALQGTPLEGKVNTLFYTQVLKDLNDQQFHPGKWLEEVTGESAGVAGMDAIRTESRVKALADSDWAKLVPVGQLRIPAITFGRGGSRINIGSQRELEQLSRKLETWPHAYLEVTGHSRSEGDAEANRNLAQARAQAAADFLISKGVPRERFRVTVAEPSGRGGDAQSVTFELGQLPY